MGVGKSKTAYMKAWVLESHWMFVLDITFADFSDMAVRVRKFLWHGFETSTNKNYICEQNWDMSGWDDPIRL